MKLRMRRHDARGARRAAWIPTMPRAAPRHPPVSRRRGDDRARCAPAPRSRAASAPRSPDASASRRSHGAPAGRCRRAGTPAEPRTCDDPRRASARPPRRRRRASARTSAAPRPQPPTAAANLSGAMARRRPSDSLEGFGRARPAPRPTTSPLPDRGMRSVATAAGRPRSKEFRRHPPHRAALRRTPASTGTAPPPLEARHENGIDTAADQGEQLRVRLLRRVADAFGGSCALQRDRGLALVIQHGGDGDAKPEPRKQRMPERKRLEPREGRDQADPPGRSGRRATCSNTPERRPCSSWARFGGRRAGTSAAIAWRDCGSTARRAPREHRLPLTERFPGPNSTIVSSARVGAAITARHRPHGVDPTKRVCIRKP